MHGNVWEWCSDWYDPNAYAKAKNVDPENTTEAKCRVFRGGMWMCNPSECRDAVRNKHSTGFRANGLGFRVVIALGQKTKPLPTPKVGSGGKELTLNLGKGVTMKLTSIPAGRFVMGSPKSEGGEADERPQRRVTISKAFYMGVTEVTQAQYESVTGKNHSSFKGFQNPVEKVSWDDATAFCMALSKKTQRTVRLPTEAQWEYACRASARTRFSFGKAGKADKDIDAHGWHKGNSGKKAHPVGQKKPNAWGLYDMHGNVCEWCRGWYADTHASAGARARKDKGRVVRGGSWPHGSQNCRAARRFRVSSSDRRNNVGFRVVVE